MGLRAREPYKLKRFRTESPGESIMALTVTLNGESRKLDAGMTVKALLVSLGLDPAKIAVERNLEIVPRSAYGRTALADGDRIEIVHFIGGG